MSHTPGPWRVLDGVADGGGICIGPEIDGVGAHCTINFNGGDSEANARLIAAAPELLEFVYRIARLYENTDSPLGQDAVALIDKAVEAK